MFTQVQERAVDAFVEHEVFATEGRTGVLLYISLFEHQVTVLGDKGIYGRANPGVWDEVCDQVIQGIRRKAPTEGVVQAIARLNEVLKELGNLAGAGDRDELPNRVRGDGGEP